VFWIAFIIRPIFCFLAFKNYKTKSIFNFLYPNYFGSLWVSYRQSVIWNLLSSLVHNIVLSNITNRRCMTFSSTIKTFNKRGTWGFVWEKQFSKKFFMIFWMIAQTGFIIKSLLIFLNDVQIFSSHWKFCKCVLKILNFNIQNIAIITLENIFFSIFTRGARNFTSKNLFFCKNLYFSA